jgi:hypothetical protein
MGKAHRGGYILFCWIGDHQPRHVHVRTDQGRKLGRLNLATLRGLEGWKPPEDLIKIIEDLIREGRL